MKKPLTRVMWKAALKNTSCDIKLYLPGNLIILSLEHPGFPCVMVSYYAILNLYSHYRTGVAHVKFYIEEDAYGC